MTAIDTPVRERPILFSTALVRAILEGRKSQTRRIIKPQPTHRLVEGVAGLTIGMNPADDGGLWYDADGINPGRPVRSPYSVGMRLWVREAFRERSVVGDSALHGEQEAEWVEYRADSATSAPGDRWRPSIHMPRGLSRITLEVTRVRAERLQEIKEEEARAEGLEPDTSDLRGYGPYVSTFAYVWQTLNGKRGYPWTANPWVWVIGFRRIA